MRVKIVERADSFEEAIKTSCDILVEQGSVEPRYFDSIIENISKYGAYFNIAPLVAMPHARPEQGAISTDLCVLKLNQPVDFMGKEVKLFFTLSAKDNTSHMEVLTKIASVCMDKAKLNKILNATSEKEIEEEM